MKKIFVIFGLLLMFAPSWAQEKGESRLAIGLGMGTKAAICETSADKVFGTGLSVIGDYFIRDKLALGSSYTFFLKSTIGDLANGQISYEANTLNIVGKYYFIIKKVNLYALSGVAFASEKSVLSSALTEDKEFKDNFFGVVLGAGAEFNLGDKLFIFTQSSYNMPLEQLIMQAGLGFKF